MFMQLSPKERFGYVALGALVLIGSSFVLGQTLRRPAAINLHETQQPPVSFDHGPSPYGGSKSSAAPSEPNSGQLIVHVVGAVARPGVVSLQSGSRVLDAIQAAGGFAQGANVEGVNLAARAQDGTQIYVPYLGSSPVPGIVVPNTGGSIHSSRVKAPSGVVNINTADVSLLTTLPGIGNSFAQRILDYRQEHGSFRSPDDLLSVQGFGKRRLEQVRQWVTAE